MVTEAPLQMRDSSLHTYLQIYQEDKQRLIEDCHFCNYVILLRENILLELLYMINVQQQDSSVSRSPCDVAVSFDS